MKKWFFLIVIISGLCFMGLLPVPDEAKLFDEDKWRAEVNSADKGKLYSDHRNDEAFFNPWLKHQFGGFLRLLSWHFSSSSREYNEQEKEYRPVVIGNTKNRILSQGNKDFILWIGHNTFLLRIDGIYWITDPIFTERAVLPKRKTPPGISITDLNSITDSINILITHNHYDHLDEESIEELPDEASVYVPLGLKKLIKDMNKKNVHEMDWWKSIDCGNDMELFCLPAQHWSRRFGQGINETLWASYLLKTKKYTIYFAGDSGYFIGYKEIGKRFPGIDYAFIPTTAYHPRWFMHYSHMNVNEAIDAFIDLGAKYFIPTQWGTFHLGDEPVGYSALDLRRTIKRRKLDSKKFISMDIGQIEILK